jgi:hypothetical protein
MKNDVPHTITPFALIVKDYDYLINKTHGSRKKNTGNECVASEQRRRQP